MISEHKKQLLGTLVEQGLIKDSQVDEIKNLSQVKDKGFDEILVGGGFVEEEKLTKIIADIVGMPYVNLNENVPTQDVVRFIPQKLSFQFKLICFDKSGQQLKVALADPDNLDSQEGLEVWKSSTDFSIEYYVCSMTGFQSALQKYGEIIEEVEQVLGEVAGEDVEAIKEEDVDQIEQVIKKAPVAKIVNLILVHAVKSKASDIHIEPMSKETRVRYRVDGVLKTSLVLPNSIHNSIVARIKVLSRLKIDETRIPQDGRIKLRIGTREIDFRVSTMPLMGQEKITLRILDSSAGPLSLIDLGFSKHFIKVADHNLSKPFGMFLVTGPTGSGKSTTLNAMLSIVNKEGVNIVTLEDPVEYFTKGVNQAQIRPEVGFTFASGLRSLLRQDPDIIMVGEIRDTETAEMAIHAALTGHLLFSTLHTNNAIGSIPRMLDMKVESFLLASTLNAIVAQRLARRICQHCKKPHELPKDVQERIRTELKKVVKTSMPEDISIKGVLQEYRGEGCARCGDTGYKGRVVLAEILPMSEQMRKIIAEGFEIDRVNAEVTRLQMVTLLQDGMMKVLQGVTTAEELFRVAAEVEDEF